jgi:DNA polymerase
MGEQQPWSLEGAVRSYAHWWREAGLECATQDLPHDWRVAQTEPFWRRENAGAPGSAAAPARAAPAPQAAVPAPSSPAGLPPATDTPDTLPAFLDWIARDAAQPEAGWEGPLVLPPAREGAPLLIVVEMPAPDAQDAAAVLAPPQARFTAAMLRSLGITAETVPVVPLAMCRPPGGLLDDPTLARLGMRMNGYLALAQPQAAILLGDRTGRVILGTQYRPNATALQPINHPQGTIRTIALPAIDLLMARPRLKAGAWQALRHLHGTLNG